MLNLTPHPITLVRENGSEVTFQPSGILARVATSEKIVSNFLGVPVVERAFGVVSGIPDDGTPCLVSSLVLSAVVGKKNVFAPDTGPTAIRDINGNVIAVTRLIKA